MSLIDSAPYESTVCQPSLISDKPFWWTKFAKSDPNCFLGCGPKGPMSCRTMGWISRHLVSLRPSILPSVHPSLSNSTSSVWGWCHVKGSADRVKFINFKCWKLNKTIHHHIAYLLSYMNAYLDFLIQAHFVYKLGLKRHYYQFFY